MTQIRNNGIEVPVPSDPYNPPADMAKMADTSDVVRRVPNQTAQNALTDLRVGTMMVRTDLPGQPAFTWDGTGWQAVAARVDAGQTTQRTFVKAKEVSVTTTEFSTGRIVFDTPFPNFCAATTLTHSTGALTVVNFRIIAKAAGYVDFVAYNAAGAGLPSSAIYLNYVAVGF